MATEAKSFLASVKDELSEAFASRYDELSDVCTDTDKLGHSMKGLHRAVWEIVEKRLKESYRNGQKGKDDTRGRTAASSEQEPPVNPFRR
jgi:hypothetical protein